MKQKGSLFIVAGVVFGFSVLAHVPARLVVPEHLGKLQFQGIGGSAWRGEIERVLYSGKALPIGTLNWRVRPTALLTGTLEAKIFERQSPTNRGSIGLHLRSRQLQLHAIHWQFSGTSLDPWFQSWVGLRGQFVLDLESLRLGENESFPRQLRGRLDWENAELRINSEIWPIGSPAMQFSGEGDDVQGIVTNSQPLLPGDSSFQCKPASCQVELSLQPTPDAPQSLPNILLLLGLQRTGDRFSGQFDLPLD